MSGKKDTQVRKISDRITDDIKFRAIDLLHGIKENWTRSEKRRFAAWLQDPTDEDWSDRYEAPVPSTKKIALLSFVAGGIVSALVRLILDLVFYA